MSSYRHCPIWLATLVIVALGSKSVDGESTAYFRYPTLHQDTVVFTSEGDLWKASVNGGMASRLTTHWEQETHARISPDGTTVAFAASYDGPTEVYVMPMAGGSPRRVTYHGESSRVAGWTPDGRIVYSTRHFSTLPNTQLVMVRPDGSNTTLLPLEMACEATFSPDSLTVFFARTTPQRGAVKRYKGGTAQQLWRFTFGDEEAVPLTTAEQYAGASRMPMWWKSRIYFLTDRDGVMNLWSMDEAGGDLQQITQQELYDVQSPALHDGRIVYQCGADLFLLDLENSESRRLDIQLSSDFEQTREKWVENPMDYLSSAHLSPSGDKVVLTSRGNVFVTPVEEGRRRHVGAYDGVRHRTAIFDEEGQSVIALADHTGEFEFWKYPANGAVDKTAITSNADVLRWSATLSPDGKYLASTDKNWRLWLHNLEAGETTQIFESKFDDIGAVRWSPDSRWLAFGATIGNQYQRLLFYEVATGETTPFTSDRVNSYSPTWHPGGEWLYFLSDRHLVSEVGSPWGLRQPEPHIDSPTRVYALALKPGIRFPFLEKNELDESKDEAGEEVATDEREAGANQGESEATNDDGDSKQKEGEVADSDEEVSVEIELKGLDQRLYVVPVRPGRYRGLAATTKHLYWMASDDDANLMVLAIDAGAESNEIVAAINGFELSEDRAKLLLEKSGAIYVFNANGKGPDLAESRVNLEGWRFPINTRKEWEQMFTDAWRMERDYFYDRGMHGIDWDAQREKYLPLVARVHDRAELSDVMYQLVGELEALHISVYGGDNRDDDFNVASASLGGRLVRDEEAGGYRIKKIYTTDPDYPDERSPLLRPEVNAAEGDIVVAINQIPTLSKSDPQLLLRNQIGRQVLLTLKAAKTGENRDVVIKPISMRAEANLRYGHWELERRKRVEEKSESRIGYVHLRAMGSANYTEFVRNFYPVFRREGLIVDMRHNRGGNIDSWILEKLMRKAWFFWQPRVGEPYWNMQFAFRGHMVVLCDEYTASDGEAFTEGFRRLELGHVIGKRTWGGEIWLTSSNRLVDRGIATAAEFGVFGPEGEWLIEGHGVEPDQVVDNLPHATFRGEDTQLDAAIEYLKKKMKEHPVTLPKHPAYPNKRAPSNP